MDVRRESPAEALIGFRCSRRDHAAGSARSTLTIHDGQWAFCAHEGPTWDHTWVATGGVRLRELLLRRSSRVDSGRGLSG